MEDKDVKELLKHIVSQFLDKGTDSQKTGDAILNFLQRKDMMGHKLADEWMEAGYRFALHLRAREIG